MGYLTAARFTAYADNVTSCWLALKGSSGTNFGAGDTTYGLSAASITLLSTIMGWGDYTLANTMGPSVSYLNGFDTNNGLGNALFFPLLSAYNTTCFNAGLGVPLTGVTSIDTFASYYNTGAGGPFGALLPPDFRDLFYAVYSNIPNANVYPTNTNLYAPLITNMGTFTVGGSFVAGGTVNTANYAGAGGLSLAVTGYTSGVGSKVVTVTLSGLNSSGVLVTGQTWTVTISGNTAGITIPQTGSVYAPTAVTGISAGAGILASTVLQVNSTAPSGRSAVGP
jgi:hypothetical protein